MVPAFVIGLREGVEASLIVGIIAAFLNQQNRRDALRWLWVGVTLAVALCTAAAVGLAVLNHDLPQQGQERLETVIALAAVAMITFMIVWMRRNARGLAAALRAEAASALAQGSAWALVLMAFLSVLREGLETAVFLLAAFQASGSATDSGFGALLGVAVAAVMGWGVYRGGVRLNLGRFFRITSVVLVLVAAGLISSAVHTAHEAGWLNIFQAQALDLSWLVRPGSLLSSLLTGMLGLQPYPTVAEAAAWLLYAVPMLGYVLWRRELGTRAQAALAGGLAALPVAAIALLAGCGHSGGKSVATRAVTTTSAARFVRVSLSNAGCSPARVTIPSGTATFHVSNAGSSAVTELEILNRSGIILGERENVVPGLPGQFTLDLAPGRYTLSCPNGTAVARAPLIVTGTSSQRVASTAVANAPRALAVQQYRAYVQHHADLLLQGTAQFTAALEAGDLARAKALFGPTRYHYEAIEPIAESFSALDAAIDARVNDVADPAAWTGFHRIEQILWVQNTTRGTVPYGRRLLRDVTTLDRRIGTLNLQPAQLANGAVELLNEVASSKITGEEDRYSHTDLSDFEANLSGSRAAFDRLRPVLVAQGDGQLAATIEARFAAVQKSLDAYRRPTALGFALYDELTPVDRRTFAAEIDALAEPLSTVAAKVTGKAQSPG